MTQSNRLDRLGAWIDGLPPAIRPAVYGALLIVLFMMMRGAWFVVPIALVYVFVTSAHPWRDVGTGAGIVALAMLGGALSGLAYGLVGRHLKQAFPGGRYLTGILTVAPYMVLLAFIIRLGDGEPLWRPLATKDFIISGFMTLLFGAVLGHTWFAPDKDAAGVQ